MNNFIGKNALDFTASAVLKDGTILKDFNFFKNTQDKNVLLFFYPMDFTFVCPSELIALNNRFNEFKSRNIDIVCISVDSCYSHKVWRELSFENGGLGNNINYTLVSDIKKDISMYYGVLDCVTGVSYRATFLIDNLKRIRVYHVNDFPIGRNIDEYIRLFDALSFHNEYGEVCQANWVAGKSGITPSIDGIKDFLKSNHDKL